MPGPAPPFTPLAALLRLPDPPASRWHRAGLSPRAQRVLNVAGTLLLALFVSGWSWTISSAVRESRLRGAPVTPSSVAAVLEGPSLAFITEAALQALLPVRGASGKVWAAIREPGDSIGAPLLPEGAHVGFADDAPDTLAPAAAGIRRLAVRIGSAIRPLGDLSVITLRPFSDKQRGRIGLYFLGQWPTERRRLPGYATPAGFIEVTEENQDTRISEHFRLRDFLTKNQGSVWPKYLVLEPRLLDKLELVLAELDSAGIDADSVRVLSGFRTPSYNETGGDPTGRAALSRHMFGDAADIFIDRDGDGRMDDLDGNGRVNTDDARVILAAVDRVEARHPALIGGAGIYGATAAHGPFIHIDTRGYRARWYD